MGVGSGPSAGNLRFPITFFVFCVLSSLAIGQESRPYSGSVGVAPTTMGTVGENLSFDFSPFPFLTVGISGSHEKIYQHDHEFEKLGGPLLGDITKDILYGGVRGITDFLWFIVEFRGMHDGYEERSIRHPGSRRRPV